VVIPPLQAQLITAVLVCAAATLTACGSGSASGGKDSAMQSCADFTVLGMSSITSSSASSSRGAQVFADATSAADKAASADSKWQPLADGWHALTDGLAHSNQAEFTSGYDAVQKVCATVDPST
jgi:hypothetical protein